MERENWLCLSLYCSTQSQTGYLYNPTIAFLCFSGRERKREIAKETEQKGRKIDKEITCCGWTSIAVHNAKPVICIIQPFLCFSIQCLLTSGHLGRARRIDYMESSWYWLGGSIVSLYSVVSLKIAAPSSSMKHSVGAMY